MNFNNNFSNYDQYGYPRPRPSNYEFQPMVRARPVVSFEEARAAQIDLDGTLNVFTDIGNKRIYTKQINKDGTASLKVYELLEEPIQMEEPQYVTKNEFEQVITSIKNAIMSKAGEVAPSTAEKQDFNF